MTRCGNIVGGPSSWRMVPSLIGLFGCGCGNKSSDGRMAGDDGGVGGEDTCTTEPCPNWTDTGGPAQGDSGGDSGAPAGSPSAVLVCPETPQRYHLNWFYGSASDDVWSGGPLLYRWDVLLSPGEVSYTVDSPQAPDTTINLMLVGVYEVQLVVTDVDLGASEPATCAQQVSAPDGLLIEVMWPRESVANLDVHLIRGAARINDPVDDATSTTSGEQDWGTLGRSSDDPEIVDSRNGALPETAELSALEEGETYSVVVTFLEEGEAGTGEPVEVVARVWLDGALLAEEQGGLEFGDSMMMGTLDADLQSWTSGGVVPE